MPAAVKANRSTKSDRAFVRALYRHLQRVKRHDARTGQAGPGSAASPLPILNDTHSGSGGTPGPTTLAYTTLLNRLDALYFFWTKKHLS